MALTTPSSALGSRMLYLCGMSLRFVLYLLSLWFLVRFVTTYVVPLFREGLRGPEGPSHVHGDAGAARRPSSPPVDVRKPDDGDYLDYEEVK